MANKEKTELNLITNRKLTKNGSTHRRIINSNAMEKTVTNPLTGRKLLNGGTVHKDLIKQGILPLVEGKLISQLTVDDIGDSTTLEQLLQQDILKPDGYVVIKRSTTGDSKLSDLRRDFNDIISWDLLSYGTLKFTEILRVAFESQVVYFNGGTHVVAGESQVSVENEKSRVSMTEKIGAWESEMPGDLTGYFVFVSDCRK